MIWKLMKEDLCTAKGVNQKRPDHELSKSGKIKMSKKIVRRGRFGAEL
jgi:hypothetical protein